jgi:hypothetical protein
MSLTTRDFTIKSKKGETASTKQIARATPGHDANATLSIE